MMYEIEEIQVKQKNFNFGHIFKTIKKNEFEKNDFL